jgi:hypothetical protein
MKEFIIMTKATIRVNVSVKAKDLVEAFQKSQVLKTDDFLTVKGDCYESTMNIEGVFVNES